MPYEKWSLFELWEEFVDWFRTPSEQDERARWVIRQEIVQLDARKLRLEKLLGEPERFRNKKIAMQMAEEMHQNLEAKRRNSPALTDAEKLDRDIWRANRTPREECRHLKGAEASRWGLDRYGGPSKGILDRDYNLAKHRFIDWSVKIWCLNGCGFVSWKGDENWEKACQMFESSSNRMTASESPVLDKK